MSAKKVVQFVLIEMPTVCWKTFPAKPMKTMSARNNNYLDNIIFRLHAHVSGVLLHNICFFVSQCQAFVSMVIVFENEGVSNNICELFFF